MSYCSKCGNQIREGGSFCDRCGAPSAAGYAGLHQESANPYDHSVTYTWAVDRKEPIIAVILSLLLPGLGQIYVGRVMRGIIIIILMSLVGLAIVPGLFLVNMDNHFGFVWWSVTAIVVYLVFFVIQVVDAYRCAEEHNRKGNVPRRY
ncbi:MAG: hypothetical protein MIO87_03505 [Methanomassiliicoccales archaeon]|nr:hypothetical protein [Methanomassiliicoccales archaeon]TFG55943.1 MAG: hypothetical protein E4H30_05950 [Methanomassiliicoccus sp.]